MLNATAIADFKARLRRELIQPGDAGYNTARKIYNGMIDRRPKMIAKCQDVADVIAAVSFGRAHDIRIAVKDKNH